MSAEFQVFSQAVGWGMVIGLGAGFCFLMMAITYLLQKFRGEVQTSEMLMNGNRSMKRGLIASAVVSSWTIGSTLLLSCTSAYNLGVSGPYWYGAGACVQIVLFSLLAIEIKRKCPNAHTYQELVRYRYGKTTHILSCVYSFIQQILYSANLLVNGSSIFSSLTGINRDACTVLLPLFVTIYTLFGGIKATFISDYTHCIIIYVLMLMFLFVTFVTSDKVGSPGALYELLTTAGEKYPVAGNHEGSLLTMSSVNGGLFGLVLFGAGFAAATDSQLIQKALAADAKYVLSAYVLGGICWFSLPFVLASTLGLACRGMEVAEFFPNYPERLTTSEIDAGLVMPIAAYVLMGKGGAAAILVMIFMACTAAFSSETVAVSSLFSHDIYKAYINPNATGKQLVIMSHTGVVSFFVVCAGLAIGLSHGGFDVSFITTISGIIVNVCIVPMACTIYWKKMSSFAYILGTTLSTGISLAIWIGFAKSYSGSVTLTTLSTYRALAAGNTSSTCIPLLLVPLFVWIKPENFDWNVWKTIKQADDAQLITEESLANEKKQEDTLVTILSGGELATEKTLAVESANEARLKRTRNIGFFVVGFFILFYLVLFPLPMYGTNYIFSKKFYKGWVVVMFLWAFFAVCCITLLPLFDGRKAIYSIIKQIITGKKNHFEFVTKTTTSSEDELKVIDAQLISSSAVSSGSVMDGNGSDSKSKQNVEIKTLN